MLKTIGFLGCGNMGGAILGGLAEVPGLELYGYNRTPQRLEPLCAKGVTAVPEIPGIAARCDILVIGVKPYLVGGVLAEALPSLKPDSVVISIAAGVSLESLAGYAGEATKIIRVMPNTPAMVGQGMASISPNGMVTAEETADAVAVFSSFGKAEVVDEKMIDAVCGLSGSGPAYVYLFIEALADGAVLEGMPRQMAYTFAAQTVLGAAKMVLKTGAHPGALKDAVCSPGGTTIEAVRTLEEGGFRAAAMNAVRASAEKNRNL